MGTERQIQNVAAGVISATSTDAVNGDQIAAANQRVAAVSSKAEAGLARSGGTMSGNIDMGKDAIKNLAGPVDAGDAANKGYVDGVAVSLKTDLKKPNCRPHLSLFTPHRRPTVKTRGTRPG